MSKYQVFALTVLLLATLAFAEKDGVSQSRNLADTCLATEVTLADATCFKCGAVDTYTKTRKNATACTCNPTALTWNTAGWCDCGDKSALLVVSGKPTCITCDVKVNSIGKNDKVSCACIGDLIWSATLKRCDCADPAVYTGDACTTCDATTNAKGVSTKTAGQCECLTKDMKWDSTKLSCVCSNANAVLFTVTEVVSCKVCGSTINSLSSSNSATSCDCPDGLTWTDNVGCACPEGQVLIPGAKPRCVDCTATGVFATGPSTDGKSCLCASDALKWNAKSGKCACPKSSQIPIGDPLTCFECKNAAAFTTLPVVGGNSCTCTNKKLTWDATTQKCACTDPTTQVFVSAPSASCITCDATINADGIDADNANKCKCLTGLTFADGKCSCGKTSAFIKDATDVITCINCNNAASYLKNRKSDTECNCVSPALKWDATKGVCSCPDSKVPYGKTSSLKCTTCSGPNVVGTLLETDPSKCTCPTELFTYSISNAGVPSCTCTDKNSIVSFAQECVTCAAAVAAGGIGSPLTGHECKCAITFFWSWTDNACKKCADDLNAKTTGGNNVACVCKTGFVWDVITQACIEPCAANDGTCLACAGLTNSDGKDSVLASTKSASTRIAVAGADSIKALLTNSAVPTNFAKLSVYQCGCADKFLWDPVHFKCVSATLN